jgi:hypothetical protein
MHIFVLDKLPTSELKIKNSKNTHHGSKLVNYINNGKSKYNNKAEIKHGLIVIFNC